MTRSVNVVSNNDGSRCAPQLCDSEPQNQQDKADADELKQRRQGREVPKRRSLFSASPSAPRVPYDKWHPLNGTTGCRCRSSRSTHPAAEDCQCVGMPSAASRPSAGPAAILLRLSQLLAPLRGQQLTPAQRAAPSSLPFPRVAAAAGGPRARVQAPLKRGALASTTKRTPASSPPVSTVDKAPSHSRRSVGENGAAGGKVGFGGEEVGAHMSAIGM